MSAEERRPKKFLFLLLPILLVVMLFVLPEKLEKETFFVTKWFVSFAESGSSRLPITGEFAPFSTTAKMGYLSSDGTILLNLEKKKGSVIGPDMWSSWDDDADEKKIQFADGTSIGIPAGEIPF